MAIEKIKLDLIDDNPYNPRKHYPPAKVKEMAVSLRELGLLQVPKGRKRDGRVQLAYGHMRKRGFASNQKHEPDAGWDMMEVDIVELSDEDMFDYSLEENMRRSDISPIEVARCIDAFSQLYPNTTDKEIGTRHSMSEANVSNMKRVLRLPEKFLEKIDEGIITFTQGRELLTLEGIPDAEELMSSALAGINTTGNKSYSKPNTVEGLQQSIHSTINGHFPPLDKEWGSYRWNILFDTRAAGCLKCDKSIITHPTKSQAAHYCINEECWEKKTEEHKAKAAAAAKAKMEAEVLERAAKDVARRTPEPALEPTPVMIDENTICVDQATLSKLVASNSCDRISEGSAVRRPVEIEGNLYLATGSDGNQVEAYLLVPREEYTGVTRTYRVPPGREYSEYYESLRTDPNGFYHGMLVKRGKEECVLVGPEVTFVAEVDKGDFSQEKSGRAAEKVPAAAAPAEIPDEVLQKAKEAAGTRAEVLDLSDICNGSQYSRQMKQGYILLSDELRHVDEPEECLERCTRGFHYAFDSKYPGEKEIFVCSDPKCLTKKKGDLTRKKNAAGQALKNAERKAIQEAIAGADHHPRGVQMLLLYAQVKGKHIATYYYGDKAKAPEKWLWDKLSAGTKEGDRNINALMKRLDKLEEDELRKLLLEMMFFYLTDHGDTGTYKIETEMPLKWLGVDIQKETSEKPEHVPIPAGVRLAQDVPQEECKQCGLGPEDHTLDLKFRTKEGHFQKVCLKDYHALSKAEPLQRMKVTDGQNS